MAHSNNVYSLLLAMSNDADAYYLEHQLKNQTAITFRIERIADIYRLIDKCKEMMPDLLIVSPIVLSDTMVPAFKKAVGGYSFPIVSYCNTLGESRLCKFFDAKISNTDAETDIIQILETVLEMDQDGDETLLTPREQEVVIAVVKGLTNKEIAEQLYLSTHTIITHRRNIARKLNIHSASGLTIYAIMNKLVTLEDIKI